MKRLLIICLFSISCICLHAQHKPKKDIQNIPRLEIVNDALFPVLDTIIEMKSKVAYKKFRDGNMFIMWFEPKKRYDTYMGERK